MVRIVTIEDQLDMPNQSDDSFEDNLPEDPEELVAEHRRAQGEINAIIDKQSEIHKAAGGRLVELPEPDDLFVWSFWAPPPEQQHLPLTKAEEVAMKELNKLEWELAEMREHRTSIETKAAVLGVQIRQKKQPADEVSKEHAEHDEGSDNVFRKEGDFWKIVYRGKQLPPIRRLKGFEYIAKLLDGQRFDSPLELIAALEGVSVSGVAKRYSEMTSEKLEEEEGLSLKKSEKPQELMDHRYEADIRKKVLELGREIREAQEDNDPAELSRLEAEKEKLLELAQKSKKLGGRSRTFDNSQKRARKAVSKAIHEAIKALEEYDSDLAEHLRKRLTPISYPFSYFDQTQPHPDIRWES